MGNEGEQGAKQVCISAGVWLQPAPTESSGTQTTPQSQPPLGPGNQPSVPKVSQFLALGKEAGHEEGYHLPGRQPVCDLGQFS